MTQPIPRATSALPAEHSSDGHPDASGGTVDGNAAIATRKSAEVGPQRTRDIGIHRRYSHRRRSRPFSTPARSSHIQSSGIERFLRPSIERALRCSEALALEPKDVDFFGSSVRVLHGKGDRSRTVGIDQGALDMIKEWVDRA